MGHIFSSLSRNNQIPKTSKKQVKDASLDASVVLSERRLGLLSAARSSARLLGGTDHGELGHRWKRFYDDFTNSLIIIRENKEINQREGGLIRNRNLIIRQNISVVLNFFRDIIIYITCSSETRAISTKHSALLDIDRY